MRTLSDLYSSLAAAFAGGARAHYNFAVVDEAQDLSVAQLRFFAALGEDRGDALFCGWKQGAGSLSLRADPT